MGFNSAFKGLIITDGLPFFLPERKQIEVLR